MNKNIITLTILGVIIFGCDKNNCNPETISATWSEGKEINIYFEDYSSFLRAEGMVKVKINSILNPQPFMYSLFLRKSVIFIRICNMHLEKLKQS